MSNNLLEMAAFYTRGDLTLTNGFPVFLIAVIVRIIALKQHNAAGFAVAKKRDRVVGGFLQKVLPLFLLAMILMI